MAQKRFNKKQERLLTLLFLRGIISREHIFLLDESPTNSQRLINTLSKEGYIKELTPILFVAGKAEKKVRFYCITLEGLRTLIENKTNPLFAKISIEETKNLGLIGTVENNATWYKRTLKTNEACALAELAGGQTPLLICKDYTATFYKESESKHDKTSSEPKDSEEENTIANLAKKALSRLSKEELEIVREVIKSAPEELADPETDFRFISAYMLDYLVAENIKNRTELKLSDFFRCRYKGIYQSKIKTVMVYDLLEPTISWLPWIVSKEVRPLPRLRRRLSAP